MDILGQTRFKCPVCGKEFYAEVDWAYKVTSRTGAKKRFCSWHCIQDYRRQHPKRKKKDTVVISPMRNYYDLLENDEVILHKRPAAEIRKALNLTRNVNLKHCATSNIKLNGKYNVAIVGQYSIQKMIR